MSGNFIMWGRPALSSSKMCLVTPKKFQVSFSMPVSSSREGSAVVLYIGLMISLAVGISPHISVTLRILLLEAGT